MLHDNLSQVIKYATHFTENSSSLIDLILLRNTANMLTSGVIDNFLPDQIRYRCPIIVLLKSLRPSVKTYKRRVWLYPQADFTRYRELLSECNFEENIERNTDLEHNMKYITNALIEASEKSIPNKIVTIRPKDHPWITCIRNLIRKRKRMFRKYKKTYVNDLRDKFKVIRNKVVNEIRKSKKEYFDKLEQLLSNESASSKVFWKASNQIPNLDKTSKNIPTLIFNGETAEDDYQKSNMLNNYFTSQSHINDDNKTLPAPTQIKHEELSHIDITQQDVIDVLSNLNVTKACGPDLISPRLLKESASVISKPLTTIFNRSLQQGYFPAPWKEANVTQIYKKEDISSPSNYRPISLLIPLFHTGPESHELTQIDKYLDSWLNRTQFVMVLTDSHSHSEFLQFLGLSVIRLKSFDLIKTLATNSLIRKIVPNS